MSRAGRSSKSTGPVEFGRVSSSPHPPGDLFQASELGQADEAI